MYMPPPSPGGAIDMRARLRPMGVGDILDETFRLYRENFLLFLATVAVIEVPIQLINLLVSFGYLGTVQRVSPIIRSISGQNGGITTVQRDALFQLLGATGWFFLVSSVVTLIGTTLMTAALTVIISQRYLGRGVTVGQAYRAALDHIGALLLMIVWVTLRLALLLVACAILVGIPFLIYFSIAWLLVTQAIMLEGVNGIGASRRSRDLVRGYWWKTLGVFVVAWLITLIFSGIVGAITNLIDRALPSSGTLVVSTIVAIIIGMLTRPVLISASTLLFYDLKIRKEAFDLEAMAQQIGASLPVSPY